VNRQNIATFDPEATAHRKNGHAILRKAGSDVAALALLQIFCFLILAYVEPRFVLIHFYQLLPYVALVLLISHGQRRWAYMIGPMASMGWLGLAYWAGLLYWAVEQLWTMEAFDSTATVVALLAVITAVIAVIMTVRCRLQWLREYAGREKSYRIFLASAGLVATYYWILIRWFWDVVIRARYPISL
jgi:hypothetical protein